MVGGTDEAYVRATSMVTGQQPTFVKDDGGSDARFICKHGIPVMVSRPLMGELHSENEWIDIDSMMQFYKICELYLKEKLAS